MVMFKFKNVYENVMAVFKFKNVHENVWEKYKVAICVGLFMNVVQSVDLRIFKIPDTGKECIEHSPKLNL